MNAAYHALSLWHIRLTCSQTECLGRNSSRVKISFSDPRYKSMRVKCGSAPSTACCGQINQQSLPMLQSCTRWTHLHEDLIKGELDWWPLIVGQAVQRGRLYSMSRKKAGGARSFPISSMRSGILPGSLFARTSCSEGSCSGFRPMYPSTALVKWQ
jgi:hypothetical protein